MLNPEQIMSLMEASRSRYQTLDAVIEVREYKLQGQLEGENRLTASVNWTIRRTPQSIYVLEDAKLFIDNPDLPTVEKEIIAGAMNQWKKIVQIQEPAKPCIKTGSVSNKPPIGHYHGVFEAIWGLGSDSDGIWRKMTKIIRKEGQVSQENGLVRLESRSAEKANSSWLILWIDPQKGYVPVRLSMLHPDKKTLSITQSTADWTMVNSLWVPLSYNRYIFTLKARQEYKVLSIKINEPISPSDMDFDFPIGTMVDNQIVGARYEIRNTRAIAAPLSISGQWTPPIAGPSLSDQQLAEAAAKAGNLSVQTQTPVSAPIENTVFTQEYVWVLPGKNQYTLELWPDTKTKPILSGKTFSDNPLLLLGVDDQLAASGKLVVTLERPADHKAFADAVLTLDFAGTKVPIHFVAAPLP